VRRIGLFSGIVAGALVLASPALAGWGEDWGTMVWGAAPVGVPTLGLLGLGLLSLALAAAAVFSLRRRAWTMSVLLVALAIPLAAVASPITGLNTFSNGTTADANEVNANFDAIEAAVNDNDSRITVVDNDAAAAQATADAAQGTADTAATAVATEATARANADISLQSAIDAEKGLRSAGDTALQTAVAFEASARASADAAHATAISTNATDIAAVAAADAAHATGISTNAVDIATNTGAISTNETAITVLQDQVAQLLALSLCEPMLVYNVPLSDYGNSGSECSGTGLHRYNGCGVGDHPSFTWVDTAASSACEVSSVLVEYTHGSSCTDGTFPVKLNGANVTTWTKIDDCTCTPALLTPGSTSFAPGASYNIGASNTVTFEGTSCNGFSPVSGSTYAVITVQY